MSLNTRQIEQFREEGYTAVAGFFTPREVAAMRAELERFKREGMLRNVATDGDGKTHSTQVQNLQICPIAPRSAFFRALPFHPKVVDAVRRLIGDPFVFYLDQIFLKPGRHGGGTNWHQDNAYFRISDPTKGTGMWTAIHEATVANGTLHVIPGSHREAYLHERDPHSDHHIFCHPPEGRAAPVELPAGGVAFFNYGVAHCTRANRTDRERAGLALHFLRTDYIPAEKRFLRVHLTGPEASGGLNEYGVKVEGTWGQEVEGMLKGAE